MSQVKKFHVTPLTAAKPGKELFLWVDNKPHTNFPVEFELNENRSVAMGIELTKKRKKGGFLAGKVQTILPDKKETSFITVEIYNIEEGQSVEKVISVGSEGFKIRIQALKRSGAAPSSQGSSQAGYQYSSQGPLVPPTSPRPQRDQSSLTNSNSQGNPSQPNTLVVPAGPLPRPPNPSTAPTRPPPSYQDSEAKNQAAGQKGLYVNPSYYQNYAANYGQAAPAYQNPPAQYANPGYPPSNLYNGAQTSTLYTQVQPSSLYQVNQPNQPNQTNYSSPSQNQSQSPSESPQISSLSTEEDLRNSGNSDNDNFHSTTRKTLQESAGREGYGIDYDEIQFIKKIGVGGCGEVWKAEWTGTPVAVKKILSPDISEDDLKEFSTEILLMSKLRHPNIVPFLGACVDPEFCLITEFMHRGSLFDVLSKNQTIPWERKISFCWDIAKGILYLHTRKPPIIHRDIKSLNILVTKEWKCTIADFGFTKIKDKAMLSTRCGSPAWSAPEVCRGEPYNESCDVYSYAIVLWEIIAGEPPYRGMNPMQLIGLVAYKNYRPRVDNLNCPYPELIQLMRDCWSEIPSQRPNFSQILERLRPLNASYD